MLTNMQKSIDLSNQALTQMYSDFKTIMKQTEPVVAAIQIIVTLKSELKVFNEQVNSYRQAFIDLKTVIKDLEDVLDLPDFYKRFVTEMKRRAAFAKKWTQKSNDAVAYFNKLSNNEQELRIRFEMKSTHFFFFLKNSDFSFSFRSSCPSVWLNQPIFANSGNNSGDVPSMKLTSAPAIPVSRFQDDQNNNNDEDEFCIVLKEGKRKKSNKTNTWLILILFQNLLN